MFVKQFVERINKIIDSHLQGFVASEQNIESQNTFSGLKQLMTSFAEDPTRRKVTEDDIKKIDEFFHQRFVDSFVKEGNATDLKAEACRQDIVLLINNELKLSIPQNYRLTLKDILQSLEAFLKPEFQSGFDPAVIVEQLLAMEELKKRLETFKNRTKFTRDRLEPLIDFFQGRAKILAGTPADPSLSRNIDLPVNKACKQLRRFEAFDISRSDNLDLRQLNVNTDAFRREMLLALAIPGINSELKRYFLSRDFLQQIQLAITAEKNKNYSSDNPFDILENNHTLTAIQMEINKLDKVKRVTIENYPIEMKNLDGLIELLRDRWVRLGPQQPRSRAVPPADSVCAELAYYIAFVTTLRAAGMCEPKTFLEPEVGFIKVVDAKAEHPLIAYVISFAKDRTSLDAQLAKLPAKMWCDYLEKFTADELAQILKNDNIEKPDQVPFEYNGSEEVNRRMLVCALSLYIKQRKAMNVSYHGLFNGALSWAASSVMTVYSEPQKTQAANCLIAALTSGETLDRIVKDLVTPGTILFSHCGALTEVNSDLGKTFQGFILSCKVMGIDFDQIKGSVQQAQKESVQKPR